MSKDKPFDIPCVTSVRDSAGELVTSQDGGGYLDKTRSELTKERNMTPRETLLSMGMKEEELDNHFSDLYVLKNDISTKFVDEYKFKRRVTTFVSQIDKKVWYELHGACEEYFTRTVKTLRNLY